MSTETNPNQEGAVSSSAQGAGTSVAYTAPLPPVQVNVQSLMQAGAHYGHQRDKWNPKMLPYIYGERNGVHIINLDMTLRLWNEARSFIVKRISEGGTLLMVGTKQQARDIIKQHAQRSNSFSVTTRWLGGTLTNFQTIKNSVERMKKLEQFLLQAQDESSGIKIVKKERVYVAKQLEKLAANLGGIRDMRRVPDVLFVVDTRKEHIAIAEARRLKIPVIALVDSNVDPTLVDFPIPANDDSSRAIDLFAHAVADAAIEGRRIYDRTPRRSDGYQKDGEGKTSRSRGRRGAAANASASEETAASREEGAVAG